MGILFCRDDIILQPCECCICSSQSRLMLYVGWRFHYPIECRIRPRRPGRQDLRPWGTGTNNCRSLQASLMPSQSLKPNQDSGCYHPQVDVELEWLACQKAHFHNFGLLHWHRSWMTLELVDRKLHHRQHDLHDLLLERNWCPKPDSSQNDPQVALRHGWLELRSTHFRYSGCGHWHSCWNFHVVELHKSPQAACEHRHQQVHQVRRVLRRVPWRVLRRVPWRVHLLGGTALSMAWPLCRLCHLCLVVGAVAHPSQDKGRICLQVVPPPVWLGCLRWNSHSFDSSHSQSCWKTPWCSPQRLDLDSQTL